MARHVLGPAVPVAAGCLCVLATLALVPGAAQAAGAWLVMVRPETALPGGIELKWGNAGSFWGAGVEFDSDAARVQSVWLGREWPIGPDTLARVAVQAGYGFDSAGLAAAGPWVGVYVGPQWVRKPVMVQFGTALRVSANAPYAPWWETSAAVGLSW